MSVSFVCVLETALKSASRSPILQPCSNQKSAAALGKKLVLESFSGSPFFGHIRRGYLWGFSQRPSILGDHPLPGLVWVCRGNRWRWISFQFSRTSHLPPSKLLNGSTVQANGTTQKQFPVIPFAVLQRHDAWLPTRVVLWGSTEKPPKW